MDGYSLLLAATFDGTSVSAVRRKVVDVARGCHLSGDRLDDLELAVDEIMTNVVRHGGGTGQLNVWRGGDLVCQVTDAGRGFDARPFLQQERPRPSEDGGMGLWLARQTSDKLTIDSGPDGTTIGIHQALGEQ